MKLKDILTEKFEIDVEIGDTILRGRFKNKPVVVKNFGVDDKGQPTINGKKMLSFRIKKLMPKKESVTGEGINETGFKNLSPFEHKLRLALKDEEKQKDFPIKVLRTIQLVKVLGRGKLKNSEEKVYKKLLKKYKLKEGKKEDAAVEKAIIAMVDSMIKAGKKPGEITKHLKSQVPYKITTNSIRKLINRKEIKPGEWLNEDHPISFSKEEMAKLHKDGSIEKDGHTYVYNEGKLNEFEGKPMPMDTPNQFAYLDFKKYAYKKRGIFKKEMLKHGGDSSKMFRTLSALWYKWAWKNDKAWTHIKDSQKFGRALMVMMVDDNLIFDKKAWKKNNKITTVKEEAPPGMEKVVKALKKKKDIDNPYAVAWGIYNKKNK